MSCFELRVGLLLCALGLSCNDGSLELLPNDATAGAPAHGGAASGGAPSGGSGTGGARSGGAANGGASGGTAGRSQGGAATAGGGSSCDTSADCRNHHLPVCDLTNHVCDRCSASNPCPNGLECNAEGECEN